jgi:hypothetical protein
MSVTIVNLTAGVISGTSGFALADTTIAVAKGAAFGAIAPTTVDAQNIGSIFSDGAGAPASNLVITAGQVGNPCCACCPNVTVGYLDPTVGFIVLGSTTTAVVNGHNLHGFSWTTGSGDLGFILEGHLPQNTFTSLEIHDSALGDITFTSAAATWAQTMAPDGITLITVWSWATGQPFHNGTTYHTSVT